MLNTPTYDSWQSMIARCERPSHKSYSHYGGRGITICDRWKTFENFFADMGNRPDGMTLDRIDNDGAYTPENCKWSTHSEQARNKRSSAIVEILGERKTVIEWSEDDRCVPSHVTFRKRIEMGWDPLDALTRKVEFHRQPPGGHLLTTQKH